MPLAMCLNKRDYTYEITNAIFPLCWPCCVVNTVPSSTGSQTRLLYTQCIVNAYNLTSEH